ncbi:hypothetical protein PYW07_011534 [Mythimna separata]|uniref:Uncharacterized protein n=1 Tax=Mythimna separata TaxID=271217 RepID=A0AAD7Y9I7_MYTSE|nr:hypothetical protein PYW07_011534 [Mythimna separata]
MYGFVMRTTVDFKRPDTYIHLSKSLIRSQLEYAVSIWSPLYKRYVESLENVQRKFLKAVRYRCRRNLSNGPCRDFKLMDLKSRRLLLEMMFLYDICSSRYDCSDLVNNLSYVVPRTVVRREVRARPLFAISSCRTNAGVRAPLRRMANNYNTFFSDIDLFTLTPNKFRNKVIKKLTN